MFQRELDIDACQGEELEEQRTEDVVEEERDNVEDASPEDDDVFKCLEGEVSSDPFKMFSKELNGQDYDIRSAEEQNAWGERKTVSQKQMAMLLFKMRSPWVLLAEICEEKLKHKAESRMLSVITKTEEGPELSHKKSDISYVLERVKCVIESGSVDLDYAKVIVEHYNVSYHHFIKLAMSEFERACYQPSKQISLLKGREAKGCPKAAEEIEKIEQRLEEKARSEGVSFRELKKINRQLKAIEIQFNYFRNRLVTTNLRQCLNIARKQEPRARMGGLQLTDLVSEGSEGLIKASEMFISGIGVKFTTYAEYWINLKISRYIKNSNPVRIPIHVSDKVYQVTTCLHEYMKTNAVEDLPSKVLVEDAMGEVLPEPIWQLACNRFKGMPVSLSCGHTDSEEDGVSFDFFSSTHQDAESVLTGEILTEEVWKLAKENLTATEYEVILGHYRHDRTFKDISECLGGRADGKNVSMIKTRALDKLRRVVGGRYGR